jgi:hypothetical protein
MSQSAYQTIVQRYGRPDVDVFDENSYRVILWSWHVHEWATHTQLSGCGKSLEEACQNLLTVANKPGAMVVEGYCNDECHEDYNKSSAAELSRKELGLWIVSRF